MAGSCFTCLLPHLLTPACCKPSPLRWVQFFSSPLFPVPIPIILEPPVPTMFTDFPVLSLLPAIVSISNFCILFLRDRGEKKRLLCIFGVPGTDEKMKQDLMGGLQKKNRQTGNLLLQKPERAKEKEPCLDTLSLLPTLPEPSPGSAFLPSCCLPPATYSLSLFPPFGGVFGGDVCIYLPVYFSVHLTTTNHYIVENIDDETWKGFWEGPDGTGWKTGGL